MTTAKETPMSSPAGAEEQFNAALSAFQAELPHVEKANTAQVKSDKGAYSYDYADLTAVTEAATPLLGKHGLSFTVKPTLHPDHGFVLHYSLRHAGGHKEEGHYPLPDPTKSSAQQIGSAITYGRRYCLCALTGIAPGGEDDDGAKANDARAATPRSRREEPAEVTPGTVRAQIAQVAKEKGLSLSQIGDDFAQREGKGLQDATVPELLAYLKLVQNGELAAAQ